MNVNKTVPIVRSSNRGGGEGGDEPCCRLQLAWNKRGKWKVSGPFCGVVELEECPRGTKVVPRTRTEKVEVVFFLFFSVLRQLPSSLEILLISLFASTCCRGDSVDLRKYLSSALAGAVTTIIIRGGNRQRGFIMTLSGCIQLLEGLRLMSWRNKVECVNKQKRVLIDKRAGIR